MLIKIISLINKMFGKLQLLENVEGIGGSIVQFRNFQFNRYCYRV